MANFENALNFQLKSDREPSAADCGTPSKSSVGSGDYELEVDVKGLKKLDASFELT